MYLSWKSFCTLCESDWKPNALESSRLLHCITLSPILYIFFFTHASWFKGARAYKSAWHAVHCDKRVNSLTVISSRTRLLQLVCNHLRHYRWKLTPERFLNTMKLTPSATNINDSHDCLPPSSWCSLFFFQICTFRVFLSFLKREIISICVTYGTSLSSHVICFFCVNAAIWQPVLVHRNKCQTFWLHKRSLKCSLGTVF